MRAPGCPTHQFRVIAAILMASAVAASAQSETNSKVPLEERLEEHSRLPALDAVRLRLWSRFGTVERFAGELDVPQPELEHYLAAHAWDLMRAPAAALTNTDLSGRAFTLASSGEPVRANAFVTADGATSNPSTRTQIRCDRDAITISFTCDEASMSRLVANRPAADPLSDTEQWFRDGDLVALKKKADFPRSNLGLKRLGYDPSSPPGASLLLDDCVILFLTPVSIGRDSSNLFPAAFVPDPAKWLSETIPVGERSRVYLEGAYYAIAINPNGAVLDLFYDPWDSGTVCPAWPSNAEIATRRSDDSWGAEIRIPWKSLQPRLNEDAVWGVDLARIRRADNPAGEVTRSANSALLKYDLPIPAPTPQSPSPPPEVAIAALPATTTTRSFPEPREWKTVAPLTGFRDTRSGRTNDAIEARIAHDAETLYIRFDCREDDLDSLRVVTAQDELREYGEHNRKRSYLDRREQFGLDWGDYIEVVLAPNDDFADRFHGGLFTFLVNSRGDLLERYYDSYGMCNVRPHPEWKSGVATRVIPSGNTWTVELAIPFDDLATAGKISSTWGLNLHRSQSAQASGSGEKHFTWSPMPRSTEIPGWPQSLRSLRDERRLGVMRLDPDHTAIGAGKNRPRAAVARSAVAAETPPAGRDRAGDRLASVTFVDRKHGWSVGGQGTILHTADGGATWREQDSGTDFILEKVFFIDSMRGWIAGGWPRDSVVSLYGGMGVILATEDGGATWTRQLEGEATWLKDIFFLDQDTGWAAGEFGTILKTTDGGAHWRQIVRTGTRAWLYGIAFVDALHGIAVGHDETILATEDGGENWTVRPGPLPRRANAWPSAYRAVAFADHRHGWIAGDGGSILATTDGGHSWVLESLDLPAAAVDLNSFENLAVAPDGTAWAVSPVALLRKRPGDGAWKLVRTGHPGWLRAACFPGDGIGWLAGERGLVLHTSNRGTTWERQHHSGRPMGVHYATAHDHHLNSAPLSVVSEDHDIAYACVSRGVRAFELDGDYNRHMVAASAMASGVSAVHSFVEFSWRLRDQPHNIAQRYQNYGGLDGIERRLVAMIRALKPRILMAEQPVLQENYYAHGVGEVARAQIRAFDSAADPEKFPELLAMGLEPHAPQKLYIITNWATEMYGIHPATLRVPASTEEFSQRLGMTHGAARARSRSCFWGMLDRALPPAPSAHVSPWNLHLVKWRGDIELPDTSLYSE